MSDLIDRQQAIDAINTWDKFGVDERGRVVRWHEGLEPYVHLRDVVIAVAGMPSAEPEIIRCKDCKHWRQQTNYQGVPLSFGFCESDDMWRSLYGETYEVSHIDTDNDFYCGYAERRADGADVNT